MGLDEMAKKGTFLDDTSIPGISQANARALSGGGRVRR